MFKSRRSSQLVLMSDDDRRSERAKQRAKGPKPPHRNDSKPYAGTGTLKKLIARRKQEVEDDKEDKDDEDMENQPSSVAPLSSTSMSAKTNTPTDWFAAASAGASLPASGSSLRVGRTKGSRVHIARPTAQGRHKFSAVYEEDDDYDPDEEARRQERATLEEAAKKIPAFDIPAGFSFAKLDVGYFSTFSRWLLNTLSRPNPFNRI